MGDLLSTIDQKMSWVALFTLATLVVIQCSVIYSPSNAFGKTALEKDLRSIAIMWLGGEVCGVALWLGGLALSVSIAVALTVSAVCSLPAFVRVIVRTVLGIPGLCSGAQALWRSTRRAAAAAFNAAVAFPDGTDSETERKMRKVLMAGIAASFAMMLIQTARNLTGLEPPTLMVAAVLLLAGVATYFVATEHSPRVIAERRTAREAVERFESEIRYRERLADLRRWDED